MIYFKNKNQFIKLQNLYINIIISNLKHQMKFNHWKFMKTALLFLMICCYRNRKATLICFFLQETVIKILISTIYLNTIFISQKMLYCRIRYESRRRKQLCRKAWENEHDYLQIERFDNMGEG